MGSHLMITAAMTKCRMQCAAAGGALECDDECRCRCDAARARALFEVAVGENERRDERPAVDEQRHPTRGRLHPQRRRVRVQNHEVRRRAACQWCIGVTVSGSSQFQTRNFTSRARTYLYQLVRVIMAYRQESASITWKIE